MNTITSENQAVASRFITFRTHYVKSTQKELADEAGLNVKTINFIENGKAVPSQKLVTYLSRKYGLVADWLFTGKGEPQNTTKREPNTMANMQARIAFLEKQVQGLQDTLNEILKKIQ